MRYFRNKRMIIMAVIICLAVGFAAVSTTLILNGTAILGINEADFDVYFSEAKIDGVSYADTIISSDGKSISYTTNDLKNIGDTSTLYYEITNASSQYDAEVELNCNEIENTYVTTSSVLTSNIIEANKTGDGLLKVELLKPSTEEMDIKIECSIVASAIERTSIGESDIVDGDVTTYSLYGYFVDDNDEVLPNANLVVYSETPHYVTTDGRGYFYVDGLEKGSHEIYYLNDTMENIKKMSKSEVKSNALANSNLTTSSKKVTFNNKYSIKDVIVELTNNTKYNITLKTSDDEIISENYEVTHNSKYGDLPEIEIANHSFLYWTYEDGTIVDENTIVATNEPHTLTAVISKVTAPVITGGSDSWKTSDVTITISIAGTAEKGIKNYEYYLTSSTDTPSNATSATGTIAKDLVVSTAGTNYVYYRTVANDGVKSAWSNAQTVKIDKTAPTNVSFSNKVNSNTSVTLNVNYQENESKIETIKCYYGDSSTNITSSGTVSNGVCTYPSTAAYAKTCVTNSANQETCSSAKKLADYFIKDGVPQVEFSVINGLGTTDGITVSQKDGYYNIIFDNKINGRRGGIYTTNTYDFSKYNYMYTEALYEMYTYTDCQPSFLVGISNPLWITEEASASYSMGIYHKSPASSYQEISARKVYAKSIDSSNVTNKYLEIGINKSNQYLNTNIYNVWFQLAE